MKTFHLGTIRLVTAAAAGCREEPIETPHSAASAEHAHHGEHGDHDEHGEYSPLASNRIDVPESVRRNLGITFAKIGQRSVARTLRVPGRFEPAPSAHREYRTMLGGRVELQVAQNQPVEPGTLLHTLDSPAWRELQERLNETDAAIQQATARVNTTEPLMAAHKNHEESLRAAVAL